MGLDMSYQAIPADSGLLERAREDVELGEMLCLIPLWLEEGRGPRPGRCAAADALWHELNELARRHPGLEKRNCYLLRWWDELHYLLSVNRRGRAGPAADELLDKAVRGGAMVAEHARGPQGIPIRYVTPAEVAGIADLLGLLTVEQLRACYSPADMEAAGVYKFVAGRDELDWEYLPQYFEAFRRFYRDVAGRDECVIVCLD
jgi:Domain of unknown function (DUF1877)